MPKPYNVKVEYKRGGGEGENFKQKPKQKTPTIFKKLTQKLARKITVDWRRILHQLAFLSNNVFHKFPPDQISGSEMRLKPMKLENKLR